MNRIWLGLGVVAVLATAVFLSRTTPTVAEPAKTPGGFQIATEDKNPWTHLKVNADPDQFQFAVVSDRTGGHRPKVFSQAVQRINLMQPEFVLSVGDLINGYTTKQEEINKEWKEFTGFATKFDMPFFYVPGNHDLTNKEQNDDWKARFGRKFYHFVYKNVLFFAVNSEDEDATEKDEKKKYKATFVSPEQTKYFAEVLKANPDVKWTMIFTHKPLWIAPDLDKNGWLAFEKALEGRKYTVFCGHVHRYQKFTRNGMNYYQLATTGGGSRLRGVEYGEFDQIAWITMKPDGPKIANVMLDGILPEDLKEPESDEPGVEVKNPPKPVPATGAITYKGQPLAGATVTFYRPPAATATNRNMVFTADGWTDKEGNFTPSTRKAFDGLPEGEYTVTVFLTESGKYYSGEVKEKSKLPPKYADWKTSPLKLIFKAGNAIKIDLAE
jgi:serine/threonine-protein phosphatase CPPED1